MTDQDPPIERLHRLDPAEPDEQDLGRLKRIDPEADDAPVGTASADAPSRAPSRTGRRVREGVTTAIALAALLSLSSIAAIGGLVAVSMRTIVPAGPRAVAAIEAGVPVTTIRVGETAEGPQKEERERPERQAEPQAPSDDFVVAPAPAPAPAPSQGGGDGGGKTDNDGQLAGPTGVGGAWCDAREGGSCDAVVGGGVLQPATEGEGYVGSEDDDVEEDDDEDDDESSDGSGSHPGKGHS